MNWVELRRWQRRAMANPLATAFVISIALHLGVFGGYKLGKHMGWSEPQFLTALRAFIDQQLLALAKPQKNQDQLVPRPTPSEPEREIIIPLSFAEIDPAAVVQDAPKDAKYYSSASTLAANPDITRDTPNPKIDGKQKQVTRVTESSKPTLQPTTPKPEPEPEPPQPKEPPKPPEPKVVTVAKVEPQPKSGETKGDLTRAPSAQEKRPLNGTAPKPPADASVMTAAAQPAPEPKRTRPRTVAEARAQQQQSPTAGERMQQEGGVKRFNVRSSLSVVGTPFGAYDAAIIAAIQSRWYALLDGKLTPVGKVVVEFNLHSNGTISDLHTVKEESTVDSLFQYMCESAIQDPSPYAVWPLEMKRAIGSDVREVRFTFYYN